jgi:hypothetical protein
MSTSDLDLEVNAAIAAISEFTLLYAAGLIRGFEAHSLGWHVKLFIGTYPDGEYVEATACRGEHALRLTREQALHARTKAPEPLPPLPGTP